MASESVKDADSPIYINLSGNYKIPSIGEKPRIGSISGDLRLATLDAFLSSLDKAMSLRAEANDTGQSHVTTSGLTDALSIAVDRCILENPGCKSVALAITSKLMPDAHEIQYNFSVIVKK